MDTPSNSKTRLNWIWGLYRIFISEALLFSIALFPIRTISGKGTVAWSCLMIMLVSTLLALVLSRGIKEKVSLFFYTISVPVMIIFSFLLGIHWSMIIIMILFIQWRFFILLKEDLEDEFFDNKNGLLILTILLGIVVYVLGKANGLPQIDSMMVLILLQILIFSFGTFVKRFVQAKHNHPFRILLVAILIIIIPLVIAGIFSLISGILRTGFLSIITVLFNIIAIILRPVIQYIFNLVPENLEPIKKPEQDKELEQLKEQANQVYTPTFTPEKGEWLYIVVFIAFVCIAIWIFFKYRKFTAYSNKTINHENFIRVSTLKKEDKGKKGFFFNPHYSKAAHQVRKYVDELERFAIKRNINRDSFESVRDWLKRIKIHPTDEWLLIYEKVRYGNIELSDQELAYFQEEYMEIKKEIRTLPPPKD